MAERIHIAKPSQLFRCFTERLLSGDLTIVERRIIQGIPDIQGEIDPGTNTIYIKSDLPQSLKEETLIHELLHDKYPNASEEIIENAAIQVYAAFGKKRRGFLAAFLHAEKPNGRIRQPGSRRTKAA